MGDLRGAKEAFRTSDHHGRIGRRAPTALLEEARVLRMKAALRRAERRLPEALELLDAALAADKRHSMRGAILISKAKAMEEIVELDQAISLLQAAEHYVRRECEPRLYLCLRHNLADYLSKTDRPEEARDLLPEVRALTKENGGEVDRLRLLWTEARVEAGLGRYDEAVELYGRTRAEFVRREIAYDAALVSLELAILHAKWGAHEKVRVLARHMVPIFQAQDVHREAHAALAVFRQAAEAERGSVELLGRILGFLYRARHHAGLRFEG